MITAIDICVPWKSVKHFKKLSPTFLYLSIYFILCDGTTTLLTMLSIVQTNAADFSATQNSYFIIIQGVSVGLSSFIGVWVQEKLSLRSKTMLHISNGACLFLALWGVIGIWTQMVGYHNLWEFWLMSALYGPSLGVQMGYAQVFMGQLIPKGEENLYFALLGLIGRGGSWIGPLVCSAIVDGTGSQSIPFAFIAVLIAIPSVAIIFVNEEKSRKECESYIAEKANGQI